MAIVLHDSCWLGHRDVSLNARIDIATSVPEEQGASGSVGRDPKFTSKIELGMVVDTSKRNSNVAVKSVTYRSAAVYAPALA